jgi:hypothetical protein
MHTWNSFHDSPGLYISHVNHIAYDHIIFYHFYETNNFVTTEQLDEAYDISASEQFFHDQQCTIKYVQQLRFRLIRCCLVDCLY